MKTEGLLPHSQEPVTCPYPESDQSSPCLPSHFLNIYFNITSHLRLCLPSGIFPAGFPTKTLCTSLLFPMPAASPVHLIFLGLITRVIFGECKSQISSLCTILHYPVSSSLLGPNILPSTLFSDTFSLCSSLSVSGQVSHPYQTAGNIKFQYILVLYFGYQTGRQNILHRIIASILLNN